LQPIDGYGLIVIVEIRVTSSCVNMYLCFGIGVVVFQVHFAYWVNHTSCLSYAMRNHAFAIYAVSDRGSLVFLCIIKATMVKKRKKSVLESTQQ
jgi:hypothetical protein